MLGNRFLFAGATCAALVFAGLSAMPKSHAEQRLPAHPAPVSKAGDVVVMLCDGKTSLAVPGLKPGQQMSHAQASAVTRELMAQWQRQHPDEKWEMAQAEKPGGGASLAPAPSEPQVGGLPLASSPRASKAIPTPAFTIATSRSGRRRPGVRRRGQAYLPRCEGTRQPNRRELRPLDPNDEKLRALEAYLIAQRKGVALDYAKH